MINLNTNLLSLMVQRNLEKSTQGLNDAIEQMSTGLKLLHAQDNAANFGIVTDLTTKINSYMAAEDNVTMGLDMISIGSESLEQISDKLSRLRALQEQAGNGTYGPRSLEAINAEANAIIDEIERLYNITEYNGINIFGDLLDPSLTVELTLQTGIDGTSSSRIDITTSFDLSDLESLRDIGLNTSPAAIADLFNTIDSLISDVTTKQTEYGATQNKLESALDSITTHYDNLVSSRSTLRDVDFAEVSSDYLCQQILQQASSSLLSAANQSPSVALGLI